MGFLQDEINSNRREQNAHAEIVQHNRLIFRLVGKQRQNQNRCVTVYEAGQSPGGDLLDKRYCLAAECAEHDAQQRHYQHYHDLALALSAVQDVIAFYRKQRDYQAAHDRDAAKHVYQSPDDRAEHRAKECAQKTHAVIAGVVLLRRGLCAASRARR